MSDARVRASAALVSAMAFAGASALAPTAQAETAESGFEASIDEPVCSGPLRPVEWQTPARFARLDIDPDAPVHDGYSSAKSMVTVASCYESAAAYNREDLAAWLVSVRSTASRDRQAFEDAPVDAEARLRAAWRVTRSSVRLTKLLRDAREFVDEDVYRLCVDSPPENPAARGEPAEASSAPSHADSAACAQARRQADALDVDVAVASQATLDAWRTITRLERDAARLEVALMRLAETEPTDAAAASLYREVGRRFSGQPVALKAAVLACDRLVRGEHFEDSLLACGLVESWDAAPLGIRFHVAVERARALHAMGRNPDAVSILERATGYAVADGTRPLTFMGSESYQELLASSIVLAAMDDLGFESLRERFAAGERASTVRVAERVADEFGAARDGSHAHRWYEELLTHEPQHVRACSWAVASVAWGWAERSPMEHRAAALQLMARYEAYVADGAHSVELRTQCRADVARAMRAIARALHARVEGDASGTVVGTHDAADRSAAYDVYEWTLQAFAPPVHDVPDHARHGSSFGRCASEEPRDGNDVALCLDDLAYTYADLLYQAGDWAHCGAAFDAVVRIDPRPAVREDAAAAAVRCDMRARGLREDGTRTSASHDPLPTEPRAWRDDERALLAAYDRFLCSPFRSVDDERAVRLRRAQLFLEAGHLVSARRSLEALRGRTDDLEFVRTRIDPLLDRIDRIAPARGLVR